MKIQLTFLLLFLSFLLNAQTEKDKWHYFAKFQKAGVTRSEQQIIIQENWEQYFKKDILKKISVYDYYPLMLDSYGSPYADERLFIGSNDDFFTGGIKKDANNMKYSMYSVFQRNKYKKLLKENISKLEDGTVKDLYTKLLNDQYKDIDAFYKEYDPTHFNAIYSGINSKLVGKKKVLFFMHGFNVPYSLACVQADALMDILKDSIGVNLKEILLVPIFWSSNNAKIDSVLSEKTFTTRNEESLENGRKYWYYSNRAYYAAITLRKVINKLDPSIELLVFSHSLGTTIATTAFISTTTKFHLKSTLKPDVDATVCNKAFLKDSTSYYNKVDYITKDLVRI